MKCVAIAGVVSLFLLAGPEATPAQTDSIQSRPVLQINPLGLLQFGPNIEAEIPVSSMVAVVPGVRIATLGLVSHLIAGLQDTSLGWAWTGSLAVHVYPEGAGVRGLYIGPRFEAGTTTTTSNTSERRFDSFLVGAAGDAGYRWILDSGLHVTAGVQSGGFRAAWEDTDGDTGTDIYFFGMIVFGVGLPL